MDAGSFPSRGSRTPLDDQIPNFFGYLPFLPTGFPIFEVTSRTNGIRRGAIGQRFQAWPRGELVSSLTSIEGRAGRRACRTNLALGADDAP
ncbi:MAG: hypothetical protein JWN63_721 [Candidatus Acidoferrum typicum]|nr:hypothetical protein [Candidatus Acidoferrum typicum]